MPPIVPYRLQYPISALMFHRYSTDVVGGAVGSTHQASQDFAYYSEQAGALNGDTFVHPFYLAAGAYTLNILGVKVNNAGKVDWYIDNVLVLAGTDWYSGVAAYNVIVTQAVAVVGNGRHTLKGVVNGQNVASGGYRATLTAMYIG